MSELITPELIVLGTGTSVGVPAFYCDCVACEEARLNPLAQRGCPGIAIRAANGAVTLLDASPDLRSQLIRENIKEVERVFLTHEHFDHIGGLPHLEFYVKLSRRKPLLVFANKETAAVIKQQFPFMLNNLELQLIADGSCLEFDNITYTALAATHSPGALGFLLQSKTDGSSSGRIAYFPDTARLPRKTSERLSDLRTLFIDATFSGNNWMPEVHNSVDDAIDIALELGAKTTYLTHLAMHYDTPTTTANLEGKLIEYNNAIKLAYDGLRIAL